MKRYGALLLAIIMIFMTGCTSGIEQVNETPKETEALTEVVEEAWPRTITDQLGRDVVIEKKPERITSSYYISTAMLVALNVEDRLVGREMKAKTRELYKRSAPEIIELPVIGSGKTLNIEQCLELKSDLVIIPFRLKEFIPKLEALDIDVIAVKPETLELFLESVEILGEATGSEERAKEFTDYYKAQVDNVKKLVGDVQEKPRVYLSGRSNVLETCTSAMYQSDMIELAGGTSVSNELTDGYWATVSVEDILNWNPDKMFIVNYAGYDKASLLEDTRLGSVKAISNEEIYRFPSNIEPWDYPTPSSILGILWLTNRLHPDAYSTERYLEEAEYFYKEFFGFEVNKEDIGIDK